MRPELFGLDLGPERLSINSYGALIAAGFLLASWLALRNARRDGTAGDGEPVLDLCFWILVTSLAGSRALFALTQLGGYVDRCTAALGAGARRVVWECTAALHVWEGGLVFYGGLLGGALATALFVRRRRLPFLPLADSLVASVPLGHFFGRLGCYAAGCCFGKPASGPLAVRFPRGSVAHQVGSEAGWVPPGADATPSLHPTQLYEALGLLALFALLVALRRRKRWHGQLLVTYVLGYAVLRFATELARGDVGRRFLVEPYLSTSQALSLAAVGVAGLILWLRKGAPSGRAS